MKTPYYIFDAEGFRRRAKEIRKMLPESELSFSIKANPFLLHALPEKDLIRSVEVCSPGELEICKSLGIPGERIIFSGVMKEENDVREAVSRDVEFLTAESPDHYELICNEGKRAGKKLKVLLRLTSGNQFGMSFEDALSILRKRDLGGLHISGIHYYSGTDKKKPRQIEKDLLRIGDFLREAEEECGFKADLLEYGPGLSAEYYEPPYEEKDRALLREASDLIREFSKKQRTWIEMGRFLSSGAGAYYTKVCDIKVNEGVNYLIVDGGIHHLKYYGQNMAMKVPPLRVLREGTEIIADDGNRADYCICGSLCTVADVLVRNVSLPLIRKGDILEFGRSGAYSVTEGSLAFLSRDLPEIWLRDGEEMKMLRGRVESWKLNC